MLSKRILEFEPYLLERDALNYSLNGIGVYMMEELWDSGVC